jgi:mono/diheme cytochrome c family protein
MSGSTALQRIAGIAGVAVTLWLVGPVTAAMAQDPAGKPTYDKWCSGCHGLDGKADGPGADHMLPRPRNFVQAQYQIRTTASGSLPTDADILRVIDEGMPGTAMPGWKNSLSDQERRNLVAYIKTFSRFFETDKPQLVEFPKAPGSSEALIAEGREAYQTLQCFKCHGDAGRGDGPSAPTQKDANNWPIRPADLSQNWLFNGGGTAEDIYHRFRTGLDGTPMPTFADALDAGVVNEEQLWGLAYYVRSMAPAGDQPSVREVIEAKRVDGPLPTSPDDSAWSAIAPSWVPLVGQVIVKPRWFSPAVTGIWVQAAHDGTDFVMRLVWDDRSNSPDPLWSDWRNRVTEVMQPREDVMPAAAPAGNGPAADSAAAMAVPEAPDAIALWFPRTIPSGMERPYFFMGNTREPVYLWHWQSRGPVQEMLGRGPGSMDPLPTGNGLVAESVFDRGQWRVTLRRPLAATDSTNALSFASGQPIPVAFFAWDGDNGEHDTKGALSTWYFVYLGEPTPKSVYATPLIATLLTAGLGFFFVGRAQRRERERNGG